MAEKTYVVEQPELIGGQTVEGFLTTCDSCTDYECDDCEEDETITIIGSATANQSGTVGNGWPYRFTINTKTLDCSPACVFLVRARYSLMTTSQRRSFFQCGPSDIWLVERYNNSGLLLEIFYVANSPSFDIGNMKFDDDYLGVPAAPGNKIPGSVANASVYFNPYGYREKYDPGGDGEAGYNEAHVGTLMFFATGDDKLVFRLAQHTRLSDGIDINPENFSMANGAEAPHEDYPAGNSGWGVKGIFKLKFFTRPIPGDLHITSNKDKWSGSSRSEQEIRYHPRLFA